MCLTSRRWRNYLGYGIYAFLITNPLSASGDQYQISPSSIDDWFFVSEDQGRLQARWWL